MGDCAEIAVDDQAQRLLAAMVGMHAPADVGEQARGVAQRSSSGVSRSFTTPDQTVGPGDQFFGMAGRA